MVPWVLVLAWLLQDIGVTAHGIAWALAALTEAFVLGAALRRQAGVPVLATLAPSACCALLAGSVSYAVVASLPPTAMLCIAAVLGSLLAYLTLAALLERSTLADLWRLGRRSLSLATHSAL